MSFIKISIQSVCEHKSQNNFILLPDASYTWTITLDHFFKSDSFIRACDKSYISNQGAI